MTLLFAAKRALEEMVNTVAPRASFTDAVDALDAAITVAEIAAAATGTAGTVRADVIADADNPEHAGLGGVAQRHDSRALFERLAAAPGRRESLVLGGAEPDFAAIAQQLEEAHGLGRLDDVGDGDSASRLLLAIAEQLRQVWNARGAADLAMLESRDLDHSSTVSVDIARALRALDR